MTEEAAPAPSIGRCIYGFALFILSISCLLLFLSWSITPSTYLYALGLNYFSSKYWAIAIPTSVCSLIAVFAMLFYPAINLILTPAPRSISTVTDIHSRKSSVDDEPCNVRKLMEEGIPCIWDMNIEYVNELLYDE